MKMHPTQAASHRRMLDMRVREIQKYASIGRVDVLAGCLSDALHHAHALHLEIMRGNLNNDGTPTT